MGKTLNKDKAIDDLLLLVAKKNKRIKKLEDALKEIAKSPQYRHVPNWVVIKIEQALKD